MSHFPPSFHLATNVSWIGCENKLRDFRCKILVKGNENDGHKRIDVCSHVIRVCSFCPHLIKCNRISFWFEVFLRRFTTNFELHTNILWLGGRERRGGWVVGRVRWLFIVKLVKLGQMEEIFFNFKNSASGLAHTCLWHFVSGAQLLTDRD